MLYMFDKTELFLNRMFTIVVTNHWQLKRSLYTHTHTHTHIHIFFYIGVRKTSHNTDFGSDTDGALRPNWTTPDPIIKVRDPVYDTYCVNSRYVHVHGVIVIFFNSFIRFVLLVQSRLILRSSMSF